MVWLLVWFVLFFVFFFEQDMSIPVQNAKPADWNTNAFWYEPWGKSGVHKGIDIFAPKGTLAIAAVSGLVVYRDRLERGGEVITILGSGWQLHYYAHLNTVDVSPGQWLSKGDKIGTVGNTGNAMDRPSHLHYSIMRIIPNPNQYSSKTQGWKLMFYLNPDKLLR
jgi:murein DD-endopeptidase MepM/ murein hydrolase activator NlpD